MKKLCVAVAILVLMSFPSPVTNAAPAPAQNSDRPEMLRNDAIAKLKVANELTKRATAILKTAQTKEALRSAMSLYAQAGQEFDNAESIFKAIGPQYVPQEYIANCEKAKQVCLHQIQMIKSRITK